MRSSSPVDLPVNRSVSRIVGGVRGVLVSLLLTVLVQTVVPPGVAAAAPPPAPSAPTPTPSASVRPVSGADGAGSSGGAGSVPVGFDPVGSVLDAAATTGSSREWVNPDRSRTVEIMAAPVRWQDPLGVWRDLDLTVAAPAGGVLAGVSSPGYGSLATSSGSAGGLVRLRTVAGLVTATPDGVLPVDGQVGTTAGAGPEAVHDRSTVTYPGALPGGRDVRETLTVDGVEETVVLPGVSSPASYRMRLGLPDGVSAADDPTAGGVLLTDAGGAPLGRVSDGTATDSAPGVRGATTRVTSRVVSSSPGAALLEVGVDPAWLADPARVFPVLVDPRLSYYTSTYAPVGQACAAAGPFNPYNTCDTYTASKAPTGCRTARTRCTWGRPGCRSPGRRPVSRTGCGSSCSSPPTTIRGRS